MRSLIFVLATSVLAVLITSCSTEQIVVTGSVLMKMNYEAHIDLGNADGLHLGDTLVVMRRMASSRGVLRIINMGEVRVISFLDEHHSVVSYVTGTLQEGDIVKPKHTARNQ